MYFWHYLGIICIIFSANLALLLISIGAGTAPSNSAIWDGFIEQHKNQTNFFNDQFEPCKFKAHFYRVGYAMLPLYIKYKILRLRLFINKILISKTYNRELT